MGNGYQNYQDKGWTQQCAVPFTKQDGKRIANKSTDWKTRPSLYQLLHNFAQVESCRGTSLRTTESERLLRWRASVALSKPGAPLRGNEHESRRRANEAGLIRVVMAMYFRRQLHALVAVWG